MKPPVVEDSELEHAVRVAKAKGGVEGSRNAAMLLTLFGTGLNPTEIAKLTVADYLLASGERNAETVVRAEIAFNGRERPLFWRNKKLVAAIDAYLEDRVKNKLGVGPKKANPPYRGLDPASALFLGRGSEPFTLRKTEKSGKVYTHAGAITNLLNKLLSQAGVDASCQSGRRTLAIKLHRKGINERVIAEILGMVSLKAVRNLVRGDPVALGDLVKGII